MKKLFILLLVLVSGDLHAAPRIQHWTTSNGARVYFFPAKTLPMMDLRVVFDAGAARDGDKHGLALLTNGMLAEGAGKWSTGQIAERFDGVGAEFSNSAMRDMSILSLRSLTQKDLLNTALETFKVVLTQPNFPQDAFERERKRLLISLESEKESPGDVTQRAFYKELYPGHPYGHMPDGDVNSIQSITTDDMKAFYKKYFVAKNAVVALVGDLTRQQAETMVENIFSQLPSGDAAPKLPEVNSLAKAKTVEIPFPSTQTHIMVGQPGIQRGDPDYFPLYVGNYVLGGGGLVSILSDEIREKRGLVYTSYSYFIPMHVQGPFILGLQTRNSAAQEALKVLHDVLDKYVKDGPTPAQLEAAKKNLTGGFALRIASNKKIVANLASIGFYNLPLDYLDNYISNINSVTLDQVKDAFKRRIHPDKMLTVIVGDTTQKTSQR